MGKNGLKPGDVIFMESLNFVLIRSVIAIFIVASVISELTRSWVIN